MRVVLIANILFLISPIIYANVYFVPTDFSSIQEAINNSTNGDQIIVDSGTYVENLNFFGKAITVNSLNGPLSTIIDGSSPVNPDFGSVILFINGEQDDSIIKGFTILNGSGFINNSGISAGGGIYCYHSSPTITYNVIINNHADSGGGICCEGPKCDPIIVNCFISNNKITSGNVGGGISCWESFALIKNCTISNHNNGGGISIWSGGSPIIYNNTIINNINRTPGGGIVCSNSPTPIIEGNTISYNRGMEGGGISLKNGVIRNNIISFNIAKFTIGGGICGGVGGGIFLKAGDVKIEGNILSYNIAMCFGGGIYCNNAKMANNTICFNIAGGGNMMDACGGGIYFENDNEYVFKNNLVFMNESYDYGGGVYCNQYSKSYLRNSTIAYNISTKGKGIFCQDGSEITIVNSILWNDSRDDIFMETGDPNITHCNTMSELQGAGNISVNPLFVDSDNNDYHIMYCSQCKNSGDNSSVVGPYDFEGNPRIAYGTVDMGADEFYTHLYYTGNASPGDKITGKLIGLPRTTPVGLFLGSGILDPSLPTMWGEFYLQSPLILLPLPAIPSNGVLEIPAAVPLSPPTPYDVPMQALIGLNAESLTNLCVLEVR